MKRPPLLYKTCFHRVCQSLKVAYNFSLLVRLMDIKNITDDARRQAFSGNFNTLKAFHNALKQLKVLILIHFVRPVILLQVATSSMQNYLIFCSFNFSVPCRITR